MHMYIVIEAATKKKREKKKTLSTDNRFLYAFFCTQFTLVAIVISSWIREILPYIHVMYFQFSYCSMCIFPYFYAPHKQNEYRNNTSHAKQTTAPIVHICTYIFRRCVLHWYLVHLTLKWGIGRFISSRFESGIVAYFVDNNFYEKNWTIRPCTQWDGLCNIM